MEVPCPAVYQVAELAVAAFLAAASAEESLVVVSRVVVSRVVVASVAEPLAVASAAACPVGAESVVEVELVVAECPVGAESVVVDSVELASAAVLLAVGSGAAEPLAELVAAELGAAALLEVESAVVERDSAVEFPAAD